MITFSMDGIDELDRQLEQLKTGTAKGALRRALRKSAQPMAALMQQNAPVMSGNLAASIKITSRLSRRQAGLHRRMFRDERASVEMFVGPGPFPQAVTQEFGTYFHPPQPFVRPAWDQDHRALLDRLKAELWSEITKTINRAASRGNLIG